MDRNMANHRIIAKFAYKRPINISRKFPGKRALKLLKMPNFPPTQTPVQHPSANKKKCKKILLPTVRASSAKVSRKDVRNSKKHVAHMLDLEGRPLKFRKFM